MTHFDHDNDYCIAIEMIIEVFNHDNDHDDDDDEYKIKKLL